MGSASLVDELAGLGDVIVNDRGSGGGERGDTVGVEMSADLVDGVVEGATGRSLRRPAGAYLPAQTFPSFLSCEMRFSRVRS